MTQFVSTLLCNAFTYRFTHSGCVDTLLLKSSFSQLGIIGPQRHKPFAESQIILCVFSDMSKSHFLVEREHVCPPYVWGSEAVCGSLCVPLMVLPCAESPRMGLNEVGYETVRSGLLSENLLLLPPPPPFPLHPSAFTSEDCRTSGLYILVSMLYIILRLQWVVWSMLKTNVMLELYHWRDKKVKLLLFWIFAKVRVC